MRLIIAIILILQITLSFAGGKPFVFREAGKLPSGATYKIEMHEVLYKHTDEKRPDDGSLWGLDGGYPRTILRNFSLQINGKDVWLPWKLHSDICHIYRVRVRESNGYVLVDIRGGNAAGSYDATYKFNGHRLMERIVRVGEFPEQVWEKTVLHNDLMDNPNM